MSKYVEAKSPGESFSVQLSGSGFRVHGLGREPVREVTLQQIESLINWADNGGVERLRKMVSEAKTKN
jgi:hypothetical protein